MPREDRVAGSFDERLSATVARRRDALAIGHVSEIGIAQSVALCGSASALEGRIGRTRLLHHSPVRMKRGEMYGNVGPELANHPLGQAIQLVVRIVLARDEKCRQLEPDIGLVSDVLDRFEDRLQLPCADIFVESLGEAFEVDIRRVQMSEQLRPWRRRDVAGRHRHR